MKAEDYQWRRFGLGLVVASWLLMAIFAVIVWQHFH